MWPLDQSVGMALLHSNLSLLLLQSPHYVMGLQSCFPLAPWMPNDPLSQSFLYQRGCVKNKCTYECTQVERVRCHRGSTCVSHDDQISQKSAAVACFTLLVWLPSLCRSNVSAQSQLYTRADPVWASLFQQSAFHMVPGLVVGLGYVALLSMAYLLRHLSHLPWR